MRTGYSECAEKPDGACPLQSPLSFSGPFLLSLSVGSFCVERDDSFDVMLIARYNAGHERGVIFEGGRVCHQRFEVDDAFVDEANRRPERVAQS